MRASRLVLVGGLLLLAANATEAAFCKKRNGAVFERTACKRKEVEVDLAAIAGAAKGDAGPPGASQPRLRVVDANGQQLPGTFDVRGQFVLRQGGRRLAVELRADGGFGREGVFYYSGSFCTEERFVRVPDTSMYEPAPIEGSLAYYAGDPLETRTVNAFSFESTAEQCMTSGGLYFAGVCCLTSATSATVGPPTALDLGVYVRPFRVEVEQ